MPEKMSPHLLLGTLDHRLAAEQDQLPISLWGPLESLLAIIRRRKLAWFEHVTRHDSLSKTILQGTLEGGRRRGRQRKCWKDIRELTFLLRPELLTMASCRKDWERISAGSSLSGSLPPPPTIQSVKALN